MLERLGQTLPYPPEIGFLPRHKLISALHNADLFVNCSEVELEGVAVLEAMSAGLPVLIADAPESAESSLALDERFSFPAGNAGILTSKIDALIDNPQALLMARKHYRKRAISFGFSSSAETLINICHALASSKRVANPTLSRVKQQYWSPRHWP